MNFLTVFCFFNVGIEENEGGNPDSCESENFEARTDSPVWQENHNTSESTIESPEMSQPMESPISTASNLLRSADCNKDPSEILLKIFPYLDPTILRSVLVNCHGNLLKAVEILSPHSMTRLKEIKPKRLDGHAAASLANYARQISAFQPPSRMDPAACRCCVRGSSLHGERDRHLMSKREATLPHTAEHDLHVQQKRKYFDYFLSLQNMNKRFANSIPVSRSVGLDVRSRPSFVETFCSECKAPSRPQDMFCRICGARITKN